MNKIVIPELRLLNIVDSLLKYVAKDIDSNVEKDSLLYNMFGEETVEGEDLYKVSKEIFSRKKIDNPRALAVRMFFDRSRAHIPTIHLSLPGESGGKNDGMGFDVGYAGEDINEELSESRKYLTREFDSTYNLVFTSENPIEVMAMYHTFRALMIALSPSLSSEFKNLTFGGQDLQINDSHAPNHIMVRALTMNFSYQVTIPELWAHKFIKDISGSNITLVDPASLEVKITAESEL